MGKVRIGKVKGVSVEIVNKYGSAFTTDFDTNKKLVGQYSDIRSKHLNNRVAGYITRLLIKQKKREEALKLEEAEVASQEGAAAEGAEVQEGMDAGPETSEVAEKLGEVTDTESKAESGKETETEAEDVSDSEAASKKKDSSPDVSS